MTDRSILFPRPIHATSLALLVLLGMGCTGEPKAPRSDSPREPEEASPSEQKIPVTTRSDAARQLYLEGRRLLDRARPSEARQLYLEALSLDEHFALAHLALSASATSGRQFFESMARAVALTDIVSEGERLMILARDAQIRGAPDEQLELLERLVELYPGDERAHALLGGYYVAHQDYAKAIPHYERAVEIAPDFSPAYNSLGYTYRALGRYDEAETAFRRYIELLPEEPNPHDSFAELLMKMGRFEESIEQYEIALALQPDFSFSYVGRAHNLILLDRYDEARATLRELGRTAADISQRRTALFWEAVSYVHQGDTDRALAAADRLLALAEQNDDPASMARDLVLKGNILLEAGRPEQAEAMFVESVQRMARADAPSEVMDTTRRNFLYWKARLELSRDRLADARQQLDSYRDRVAERGLPTEIRRVHELAGELALLEGRAEDALAELSEANQQDPRVLLLAAAAHRLNGQRREALRLAQRAADFNALSLSYAFVRAPARELTAELRAEFAAASTAATTSPRS